MFKNCAICGSDHETYVREMPDGSSHVHQDAETLRRRNAATVTFKGRVNARLAK